MFESYPIYPNEINNSFIGVSVLESMHTLSLLSFMNWQYVQTNESNYQEI